MLPIGIIGISHKTADLGLREAVSFGAEALRGERGLFFQHPTVLLSTCNRTEIYFDAEDLAEAHSDILSYLRGKINVSFEQNLYAFFGVDCFFHLCSVTAGLESAIIAETEIQRQVKLAYGEARFLTPRLHYIFQKALKVGKNVRCKMANGVSEPTLNSMLWQLAEWKQKRVLIVGYSEINRGLISFLTHKGVKNITLSTRNPESISLNGVKVLGREALSAWQKYDVIVTATKTCEYLITGEGRDQQVIFDLSVPRNVNPDVRARVYNIEEINQLIKQKRSGDVKEGFDTFIWENVLRLSACYMKRRRYSKFGMSRVSGEWDHIPDVFHTGDKKDEPFKAEAKASMGNGAIFSKL